MCLIALAWQSRTGWPLIIAANRDEFFDRETRAAHWWESDPRILAGQDLAAGGTWMGITRDGRFAALTNVRQPGAAPAQRSRGELVARWLGGSREQSPLAAAQEAFDQGAQFGGFHLLLGSLGALPSSHPTAPSLVWTCNRVRGEPRIVDPGVWAWSNGEPDHEWPKTRRLRAAMDSATTHTAFDAVPESPMVTTLLDALADSRQAPDDQLPLTGIGLERERRLSAAFIPAHPLVNGNVYGTRASTIVRVAADASVKWLERSFATDGSHIDRSDFFQMRLQPFGEPVSEPVAT